MNLPTKPFVVIAAYNEASNLAVLVPRLLALPGSLRVVVVDDNSPDGSADLLRQMAQESGGRVIPVIRPGKQGYGTAVFAGLGRALEEGADAVVTMDADLSHDPDSVPDLLNAMATDSIAIGSRYCGGIRVLNWHPSRLFLSLFANRYVNTVLGLRLADATSGFRAYRRPAVEYLLKAKIGSRGYAFLVEVIYRLVQGGFVPTEVPIIYSERREGQSKMSKRVIFEAMWRPWVLRFGPRRRT